MVTMRAQGRPGVTTREEIEAAAFGLFADHGYEATTMAMIAQRVAIGRRTLFRYFPSKHDIVWGAFDRSLREFADLLAASPDDVAVHEAVTDAVVRFNARAAADPAHRHRMRLILHEPTLQTHSALRYAEWREVLAGFVAGRLGISAHDPMAQLAAYSTNAVALAAYVRWVRDPDLPFADAMREAASSLRDYWRI